MRLERRSRERAGPPVGALVGGALALAGVGAAAWLRLGLPRPVCPLREWTGIPCLTCGTTRMLESLLAGDVLGALAWNPLVFLGLTAAALWAVLSTARFVFGLPSWRVVAAPRERLALRLLVVVALAAGWAWLLWRGA